MINSLERMGENIEDNSKKSLEYFRIGNSSAIYYDDSENENSLFKELISRGKTLATNLNEKNTIDNCVNGWLDNCFKDDGRAKTEGFERWESTYSNFRNKLNEIGLLGRLKNFSLTEVKRDDIDVEKLNGRKKNDEHSLLISAEYCGFLGSSYEGSPNKSRIVSQLLIFSVASANKIYLARTNFLPYMELPSEYVNNIKKRKHRRS